ARHRGHPADRPGRRNREPAARGRTAAIAHPGRGAGERARGRQRYVPRARDPGRDVTDDLTQLTIKDASRLLRLGSISAADLVTAHVQRIERLDQHVKAFLRFTPELWEKQADEADRRLKQGDAPPLCDIPLAVKDGLCVRGVE